MYEHIYVCMIILYNRTLTSVCKYICTYVRTFLVAKGYAALLSFNAEHTKNWQVKKENRNNIEEKAKN